MRSGTHETIDYHSTSRPIEDATGAGSAAGDPGSGGTGQDSSREQGPSSSSASPAPESFGRYKVRSILGRGGFGTVYLGHDEQLGRDVAIKVPNIRFATDGEKEEFLAEARQLAQLRHPGIVMVFDVGVDRGRCYIVSDYLRGQTLADWMSQHRPTLAQTVTIVAALADALAHAHSHRTVHRDLKPANVILVDNCMPVLVDFGLAANDPANTGSQKGVVMGTPSHMSPEQAKGEGHRIDGRTDIFALGVILYTMLTGQQPFQATKVRELMRQITEDEPQPPRQLVHTIPPELERICLKALAKKFADRYTTAADMAIELRQLLGGPGLVNHSAPLVTNPSGSGSTLEVADSLETTSPLAGLQAGSQQITPAPEAKFEPFPTPPKPPEATEDSANRTSSSIRRAREAERRRLTVLHCGCDLYDSEEIVGFLDPEEQRDVLLAFQQQCQQAVEQFEGAVVQTTDTGLVACFGYPLAFEDAPQCAIRAGRTIIQGMQALNQRFGLKDETVLSALIAAHCDMAVVEDKGGDGASFSIVGQVRSVAGHLESVADPNTLVISADMHRLVKGFFECESLGVQRIKGLGKTDVYQVHSERSTGSRVDAAESADLTPLIGRDREVGLLEERWEQAAEGMGQVVLLIGEAGLGKSRLVHVLKQHVVSQQQEDAESVIEWRCSPHHQNSSLHPAIDCLERMLGFSLDDAPQSRLDRLVAHLEQVNLNGDEEIGIFASLLSIPLEGRYPELELPPQRQKEKTLDLLLDWLRELSYQQPALFIVEDLHWVDPTTLEFLESHVDQGLNDSILTLLSFRPDFETPWKSKAHQTSVALNRLTKRQIHEMMVLKSGVKNIPTSIVEQVVERTDGVPLFVEEVTIMIVESGSLREVGGNTEISGSFALHEIPATLHDLLMARLDRMASDIEVVQLAATAGRDFTYELLRSVSPLEEASLQEELAKLVDAGLLHQRGRPPRTRYTFKHALIQDAAYQSLLKKKRQQFHQQIADVLESSFPDICQKQPEVVAHHFTEADAAAKAVEYWDRAGTRAMDRCAHLEAIEHLKHGLDLIQTLPESPERHAHEIKMHISLGVPLQSTKGYSAPEVQQNYARAHQLCQELGLTTQLFPVLYGLFRYNMLQANYEKAEQFGDQLVGIADQTQNPNFLAAAHRALGGPLVYQGRHTQALKHLRKVIAIEPTSELRAEAYGYDVVDPWITSRSYMSWALWLLGYPEQALEQTERAIQEAEGLRHPFSVALALSFGQWLFQFCHDVDRTRDTCERALTISTEQSFAFWIGWGRVLRGWTLSQEGRHDEATTEIREGIVDWRAQGSELGCHYYYVLLAEAHAAAGQFDQALEALGQATEFANETGEGYWASEISRLKGEVLLQRDPTALADAETCFLESLQTARDQEAKSLELRTAMSLLRLLERQGRRVEGLAALREVYDWFSEGFETHDLRQAKAMLESP
jgi:serine/threonine protein kinase/predicted ATPase